jgi:hypothetical protein
MGCKESKHKCVEEPRAAASPKEYMPPACSALLEPNLTTNGTLTTNGVASNSSAQSGFSERFRSRTSLDKASTGADEDDPVKRTPAK